MRARAPRDPRGSSGSPASTSQVTSRPAAGRLAAEFLDDAPEPIAGDVGRLELPRVGAGLDAAEAEQALDHPVQPLGFVRQQLVVLRFALLARRRRATPAGR